MVKMLINMFDILLEKLIKQIFNLNILNLFME